MIHMNYAEVCVLDGSLCIEDHPRLSSKRPALNLLAASKDVFCFAANSPKSFISTVVPRQSHLLRSNSRDTYFPFAQTVFLRLLKQFPTANTTWSRTNLSNYQGAEHVPLLSKMEDFKDKTFLQTYHHDLHENPATEVVYQFLNTIDTNKPWISLKMATML